MTFRAEFSELLSPVSFIEETITIGDDGDPEVELESKYETVGLKRPIRSPSFQEVSDRETTLLSWTLYCPPDDEDGKEMNPDETMKVVFKHDYEEEDDEDLYEIKRVDKPIGHHFEIEIELITDD